MPFLIVRDNIVNIKADALVNAANSRLLPGGGVCGAVFQAAGFDLMHEACKSIGFCNPGDAVITPGFNLFADYVIHTVGPVWTDGKSGEEEILRSCYRNSFKLAYERGLKSIAFPLLASGNFGYPKDLALKIAISELSDFVLENPITAYLCVYDRQSFCLSEKVLSGIKSYIDDNYIDDRSQPVENYVRVFSPLSQHNVQAEIYKHVKPYLEGKTCGSALQEQPLDDSVQVHEKLQDLLSHTDATFSETLLSLITLSGKKDSEIYNRANIDRRLFSKIRTNKHYRPSKSTVAAFCIALELSLQQTKDLLQRAGYSLTHTSKFDIILEYYIQQGIYDIFEINEVLFYYDQTLLGSL